MTVRPFAASTDLDELNRWLDVRGLMPVEAHALPIVGMIVPGVAAGFLYRTDSSIGFLDGFASNPEAPKETRAAALLHIGDALASRFDGRFLLVYTEHVGISRWCRETGFTDRGSMRLFTRER